MANKSVRFRNFVTSFSFKERRAKELLKYRQRIDELEKMNLEEINFEYINLKSAYEHKKSILTLLIISSALAILMNVWKYFFAFVDNALKYASTFVGNEMEIAKISFIIAVITAATITFLILFILKEYMKEIKRMQRELMIIEIVRNNLLSKR